MTAIVPLPVHVGLRGSQVCSLADTSATAFSAMHNRRRPAYRAPEDLAQDIRNIARFSRGPVFILGDIRQAGDDYADRFLRAIHGFQGDQAAVALLAAHVHTRHAVHHDRAAIPALGRNGAGLRGDLGDTPFDSLGLQRSGKRDQGKHQDEPFHISLLEVAGCVNGSIRGDRLPESFLRFA